MKRQNCEYRIEVDNYQPRRVALGQQSRGLQSFANHDDSFGHGEILVKWPWLSATRALAACVATRGVVAHTSLPPGGPVVVRSPTDHR